MRVNPDSATPVPVRIVGLRYFSLYFKRLQEAIAFYSQVLGPPASVDESREIYGWRMGETWLTLFSSKSGTDPDSDPRNAEFAIQVSSPEEVDRLHKAFVEAGAESFMMPADTTMYEP